MTSKKVIEKPRDNQYNERPRNNTKNLFFDFKSIIIAIIIATSSMLIYHYITDKIASKKKADALIQAKIDKLVDELIAEDKKTSYTGNEQDDLKIYKEKFLSRVKRNYHPNTSSKKTSMYLTIDKEGYIVDSNMDSGIKKFVSQDGNTISCSFTPEYTALESSFFERDSKDHQYSVYAVEPLPQSYNKDTLVLTIIFDSNDIHYDE